MKSLRAVVWMCVGVYSHPALSSLVGLTAAAAEEPLRVRMENFRVPPATGPVVNVLVENRADRPVDAVVRVRWPEGWKAEPEEQRVSLDPGATVKAPFTLQQTVNLAANRYEVVVEARAGEVTVARTQQVVCATAPYLKPRIDGRLDDWKDALPITFPTDGKATTVMTCWNRPQFCVAVRVEEETLIPLGEAAPAGPDAVQWAVAPPSLPPAGGGDGEQSGRYEFVVIAGATPGPARCFLLLRPGDDLRLAGQPRPLEGLECREVEAVVGREGVQTCYEIAVPVSLMPELRPTTGRPFSFSLLVQDPDGTGLRDLGTVMNWWDDQRPPWSWCRWQGAAFGPTPPFDSSGEFGFSSSIH